MPEAYTETLINEDNLPPHDVQIVVMYGGTEGQEEHLGLWRSKGYHYLGSSDNLSKWLRLLRGDNGITGLIIGGLKRRSCMSVNRVDWLFEEIRDRTRLPQLKTVILSFDGMELPWNELPTTKMWGARPPKVLRWWKHNVVHWLPDTDYLRYMANKTEESGQEQQETSKRKAEAKKERRNSKVKKMKLLRDEAAKSFKKK